MDAPVTDRLITIGELSRLTGVPVRTIRFYADERLVEPATRSTGGYRLYDARAAARLELVRTLRELGIDLPSIARVLAREVTVAEVARAHADALGATIRVARLRQAVLRAVAGRESDWEEMELMHRLAKIDAAERRRILEGFLDRTFGGLDEESGTQGQFATMMRSTFPELPPEPTTAQVEAWVELVTMIQDDSFVARVRQMTTRAADARSGASGSTGLTDPNLGVFIAEQAAAAYAEGIEPTSAAGTARAREITAAVAERAGVPDTPQWRAELRTDLEIFTDRRVERYWQLVGAVAGQQGGPGPDGPGEDPAGGAAGRPGVPAMEWLIEAMRAAA